MKLLKVKYEYANLKTALVEFVKTKFLMLDFWEHLNKFQVPFLQDIREWFWSRCKKIHACPAGVLDRGTLIVIMRIL